MRVPICNNNKKNVKREIEASRPDTRPPGTQKSETTKERKKKERKNNHANLMKTGVFFQER